MFTTSSLIFGTLLIVKWRCQVIIPTERLTGTARRRCVSPDTSDSKTSRQEGRKGVGREELPSPHTNKGREYGYRIWFWGTMLVLHTSW